MEHHLSACTSIESSPRNHMEPTEDHAIDESRTLFLGDLPPNATVEQISALFPDLQVSHVEIKIINSTKGTLCYSFISFANADYCQRAFDKYDGKQALFPDGTIVRIGWAKRNSRLHVSNLDENTTEKDLIDLFTKYGDLSPQDGILVIKKPSSNPQIQHQTVCYGVVNFDQRESAETAKNALHNTYFGGRRLRVEWNRASRKSLVTRFPSDESLPNDSLLNYAPQSPVISIYVQFETLDTESTANEALIAEVFEPFGHMTGCFIKTNNTSVSGLRQHGYAFVHFDNSYEGKKSALAAAAISKDCPYQHQGVLFHAEISKNFKKATSHSNQSSYQPYRSPYSVSASRDEDDFGSLSDENYGESYKSSKSDYSSHGSSSPGATYYYPQPNSINQYMVPYNSHHSNHHNSHHSNQSHHQSSHHNHSMVYPVQYQTPYTSSYSPGGSNSDFTENPAMYYVKQPYSNYSSHNQHSSNHMSNYSSNGSSNGSNSSIERSYSQSTSDSSLVPSALQPSMSYNGSSSNSVGSSGPNTPTASSHGTNMPTRYYTGGGWQQQQQM